MIYWRLLLIGIFVVSVCLLNMPRQIQRMEYSLAHSRTRMLERELVAVRKDLAVVEKAPFSPNYPETLDRLAYIYYQMSDVNNAEATLTRELSLCAEHKTKGFDPHYEKSLLSLATFYRERANYERAEHFYNMVRDYDMENTSNSDPRRARDAANLGLTYFLWGETYTEDKKRADVLCRAESFCETALNKYQTIPGTDRAQGNVFATQALVLRDLGLADRAKEALKRSREILARAGNAAIEP